MKMNEKDFMDWLASMSVLKNMKCLSLIQAPLRKHMTLKVWFFNYLFISHQKQGKT